MKLKILMLLISCLSLQTLAQSAWPWQQAGEDVESVTLLLMGDTNIQDRTDPDQAYQYVLPTLQAADLSFTNLEGAFSGSGRGPLYPDIPHKDSWKHSEPDQVKVLLASGIDAVGVANNVTYPWQAMMRSLSVLDSVKIPYVGGGKNLQEAHRPLLIEKKGVKFGILQYTATFWPYDHAATPEHPGVATVKVHTFYQPPRQVLDKPGQPPIIITIPDEKELEYMIEDISRLRKKVDILVVSYHWGVSSHQPVIDYQRTLAHKAISAGADVIMGHGVHLLQPVEMWHGKPIFYCLGNFVFDWWKQRDEPDGLLARIAVSDKKVVRVSLVPVHRDEENNPHLLDPNQGHGAYLYKQLLDLGGSTGAALNIAGKEIIVSEKL